MNNLPVVLVNTWLLIEADKSEENRSARKVAVKNLIKAFGNIDVAQRYVDENKKDKATRSLENA